MGRDIPFNENAVCDSCGKTGAFDFMGDFICGDCVSKTQMVDEENLDDDCPKCGAVLNAAMQCWHCDDLNKA